LQKYRYNSALRKALLVDIEAARELMIKIGLEEGFTWYAPLIVDK